MDNIDWELANAAAERWARQYGYTLVRQITETTKQRIAAEVAEWTRNSESLSKLTERLMGDATTDAFSRRRAKLIATTEVTRVYAEGNMVAWRESGVIQQRKWQTGNDELVCPICGPLHNEVRGLDESFSVGIMQPPAHPNCRCWIVPVSRYEDELTRLEQQDMTAFFDNDSGIDTYAAIRPPEGRAPAGLGAEYAARRRIISRIQTQEQWRSKIQANLLQYRGQANQSWRIAEGKARMGELDKAITAMMDIATQPEGDWSFKAEMVDSIIEYVQALTKSR